MGDTTSTPHERSFVSIRGGLVKRTPRFELMPDEKLIHQGFVIRITRVWYGLNRKVCDGYLTSHRIVVCRKFFGRPDGNGRGGWTFIMYYITLMFIYRKSKKIAFEFPLADMLKFEKMNAPDRHWYMFELQDGRKYVLDFRELFFSGNLNLTWPEQDRWVAAIEVAVQSVQKRLRNYSQ